MRCKFAGLFALAVGLGMAQTAFAADLAVHMPTKASPMMTVAQTWTGCYVGVNVGAAWSHDYVFDEAPPHGPIATLDDTNVIGGGQVGCDYEFANKVVVGVQGMFDGTGLQADASGGALTPATLHGSIPWLATVTGRLGYAVAPDWLVYGKGGGAWTRVNSNLTFGGATIGTANFDLSGWTAGGGGEWRFAPSWSVFAEYDYTAYGEKTIYLPGNIGTVQQHVQMALLGLNFRFGMH
jgi:outer membrane immunogenic protein